ncbi:hypothetical protein [Ottowia thiooxydans]|uniref:Uncharacterized protein n=1 Tax=Ottowia thiooxydans TaxID=219182 RepID=A0ABV2Q8Y2_9BURK
MPPLDPQVGSFPLSQNARFPTPVGKVSSTPRVSINQGPSLSPSLSESGELSEIEELKSNFEVLRKMKCVFDNYAMVANFSWDEVMRLNGYAMELNDSQANTDVSELFSLATERYKREVWGDAFTNRHGLIFTRYELTVLRECRIKLMGETELLEGVSRIYGKLKDHLATSTEEAVRSFKLVEKPPIEIRDESPAKNYPAQWLVKTSCISDSMSLAISDVLFWMEYSAYDRQKKQLCIVLVEDMDDTKALVALNNVRDSIKEQSVHRLERDRLARHRMKSRLPLACYLPETEDA